MRPEITRFAVDDILRRLRGEFSYHAEAQRLGFRVVPCGLMIDSDPRLIEQILRAAAAAANARVLGVHLHHFGERMGVTGVALLAESHLSIHTWPESGYAAVDVFTCGDHTMPESACRVLAEELRFIHPLKVLMEAVFFSTRWMHQSFAQPPE
jgi:S-adenosylmethionine decarboxylase